MERLPEGEMMGSNQRYNGAIACGRNRSAKAHYKEAVKQRLAKQNG